MNNGCLGTYNTLPKWQKPPVFNSPFYNLITGEFEAF